MDDATLMKLTGANKHLLGLFKQRRRDAKNEAEEFKKHFFKKEIRVLGISGSKRNPEDCAQESSTTEWLLDKCLDEARKLGANTKKMRLQDYDIQPCKGCYYTTNNQCHYKCTCYPEGKFGDEMTNKLYGMCMWADVIVWATPIQNFKISSLMGLFLDRLISMDGSLKPADIHNIKNKEINKKHTKFIELTATNEFGSGFLRRFTGKIAGIIVSGHEVGASLTISSLFMTLNQFGMLFPPFSSMYAINTVCESTSSDTKALRNKCHEDDARLLARNLMAAAKIAKRKNDYWWSYDGRGN